MKKILIAITFDSHLYWGLKVMQDLASSGFKVEIKHVFVKSEGNVLTKRQKSFGDIKIQTIDINRYQNILNKYDYCFIGAGAKFADKLIELAKNTKCKTISYFPGLCVYNKIKGFLYRYESDLILFNSKADFALYKLLANELGFEGGNGMVFGIPFKQDIKRKPITFFKEAKNVYYVDQTVVPETKQRRIYLINRIVELARKNQDKNFIIKLRVFSNEVSTHEDRYNLQILYNKFVKEKPSNISFTTEALKNQDLVISISSTMLIQEALCGVAICSITDFGFNEIYSNEIFIGSRALKSFDDFANPDCKFDINKEWLLEVSGNYQNGIASLIELLKQDKINKNIQQGSNSAERWSGYLDMRKKITPLGKIKLFLKSIFMRFRCS